MSRRSSRRQFLKQTAATGLGFWVAGGLMTSQSRAANAKLNFACIGVGGKGGGDTDQVGNHGNVVALCDIDDNTLNGKAQRFPDAKKYNDFRKMLNEMGDKIDAVTVSTPDHTHAVAAITAMKMKKHVYCQKPLTHTVYEARQMREVAAKMNVCTQMGNQGTASNGLRRAVEMIRAGVIGPVNEVHVWTNRPIWPQGTEGILKVGAARKAAYAALHGKSSEFTDRTPPKHVHWDLFLGPAPERPYDSIYHPFSWRGWWDFGTGALGDMACHTANMAFMALKLGSPTSIQAESGEINPETYPMWAKITFQFPARDDMPAVKFVWYEGMKDRKRVLPPHNLIKGHQFSDSGSLLVGEKGVLFSPNDYGEEYTLLPEKNFEGYKGPSETLPRTSGDLDKAMKAEWVRAIQENKPSIAMSNFNYAGVLTEAILLGNVAMRVRKKIEWDGENLRATNCKEAEQYINPKRREGWEL